MKQITNSIMMIKPVGFRYNEQTAVNNYYQQVLDDLTDEQIQKSTPAPATSKSSFSDYDLSVRTLNALDNAGIKSPEQLSAMSNKEIKQIKGITYLGVGNV